MNKIIVSNKINNKFMVFLLMLTFVNFATYGWISLLILIPVAVLSTRILYSIDSNFLMLLLFGITYCIIGDILYRGYGFIIILVFGTPFLYLIGRYIARRNSSIGIIKILILCITSLASIFVISILQEITNNGFVGISRNIPIIGLGSEMAATGTAANMSLLIGLFGICLLKSKSKEEKIIIIFITAASMLALFCSLRLGTRTSIVLFLTSFFVSLVLTFKRFSIAQKLLLAFVIVAIVISVNIFFNSDSTYTTFFMDRMNSDEYGLSTGGGRTERAMKAIELLPQYPMGNMPGDFFAHNIWLDVARVSGVIPMVILLIATINFLINLLRTLKSNRFTLFLKIFLLVPSVIILAQMMVEPILEGVIGLYMFFGLLFGMLKEININRKFG